MSLSDAALSLVVIAFCFLVLPSLDRRSAIARQSLFVLIFLLSLYYLNWRVVYTILPFTFFTGQGVWIWLCFFVELLTIAESAIFFITMLKRTDYKKEAEQYEKILRTLPESQLPTVDIFIPTVNESIEILERSILGALYVDWPREKLNVWVLDDGKRDWLKTYCEEHGAGYIRRIKNRFAKAGNINNALEFSKGEYILINDADFVPFRNFLYRTIGFFKDPKIAIVQTPQFFFNKDYVQANLHLQETGIDDQRLFFDEMMPARDGWGAAFCCGSCSVSKRSVLQAAGGIPTQSITEDLLTSLVLIRHGYITRYLSEKLSHGLAPESLAAISKQRKRWCRGTMQTLWHKTGPFGPGLTFVQRLLFLPFHWLISPITRIMSFIVPIVFLLTGLSAIAIDHYGLLIHYQFPLLILNYFVVPWLLPKHSIPFLNTAINSMNAIHVLPTAISSLFRPESSKSAFEVTPKGVDSRSKGIHSFSFWVSLTLFIFTAFGILINLFPSLKPVYDNGFFPIAAFWSVVNIILLSIMILLSFEHPRWRVDERFKAREQQTATINGMNVLVNLVDLSLGGVAFSRDPNIELKAGDIFTLNFPYVGDVTTKAIIVTDKVIKCQFVDLEGGQRERMIQHVYTGQYDNTDHITSQANIFKRIFHRAFGEFEGLYIKGKNPNAK